MTTPIAEGIVPGNPISCPKCGHTKFHPTYRPARKAGRFLWWKTPATAEALELYCTVCGYQWDVEPGTVRVRPQEQKA